MKKYLITLSLTAVLAACGKSEPPKVAPAAATTPPPATPAQNAPVKATPQPAADPQQAQQTAPSANLANKAKFNAIKTGMKEADVYAIIGGEGELLTENEMAGIKTSMHQWQSDSGIGNMSIMFQGGKVVNKSQFGLN